jgi:hypothetical protein
VNRTADGAFEHLSDNRCEAIDVANTIRASGCWYDRFLYDVGGYAAGERIDTRAMRVLDTGRDFRPDVVPVPYDANHDQSTLINRIGGRARWWATQPATIALFTCSGAPLLRNGAEFGDDQHLPSSGPGRVQPRPLNWELAEEASANPSASCTTASARSGPRTPPCAARTSTPAATTNAGNTSITTDTASTPIAG